MFKFTKNALGMGALAVAMGCMLSFTPGLVYAQKNTKRLSENGNIPLHPKVVFGTLPNGFQYYILANKEPKERVQFYLAHKVGSILETESQRGLAHFLEHMNFNGTRHFPKNALVNYLQHAGIRFGADLNAYTGFEETVYQLPLPTKDKALLDQGLLIMRDWAHGALLEGEEIDKERGVILEEKRQRGGLSERMQAKFFPLLTNGSRYAERIPIGTEEVLKNFNHQEIRRFYNDWYRPNLQALLIVGDIDPVYMEQQVKVLFSDLTNPKNAPKRAKYNIPLKGKNQFLSFSDAEITQSQLQFHFKMPQRKTQTIDDYAYNIHRGLATQLLNARIQELGRKAEAPFLSAGVGFNALMGGVESFQIQLSPKPQQLQQSVQQLFYSLQQARQHGFTTGELERAQRNYLATLTMQDKEASKKSSTSYMNELLANFLQQSPAPAHDDISPRIREIVENLDINLLQDILKEVTFTKNRDILLFNPEKSENNSLDQGSIEQMLHQALAQETKPYVEALVAGNLLPELPTAGTIVRKAYFDSVAAQRWTLSNGIELWVKPTNFKNDEILMSAYSPGGHSQYDIDDFQSAVQAAAIVSSSGLGDHDAAQLHKLLAGKTLSVQPFIQELGEGFQGATNQENMETFFQIIYGYFRLPRLDTALINNQLNKSKIALENRHLQPQAVFADSIATLLYQGNPRKTGPSLAKIDQIDLQRALAIYKERFADASDFTFVFVGNIDTLKLEQLAAQYLASLPNLGRKEEGKDLGIYPAAKGFQAWIKKGQEDKANVNLAYTGDYDFHADNNLAMDALAYTLNNALLETLREEKAGIYSVQVSPSYSEKPRPRYTVNMAYTSNPQQAEELIEATLQEVQRLQQNGPSAEDMHKFKAQRLLGLEQNINQNTFWLNYLLNTALSKQDIEAVNHYKAKIEGLTADKVQDMAIRYLQNDQLFRFILIPEN
ncbi:M16 family metallopeptidase [Sphingobacterium sp. Mn56C]|uniref:M16 family metallopeptidase n=1 Tax=Sphingobacterium sp. Mn56C TaxID=3395261 RepID=UPI003BC3DCBE